MADLPFMHDPAIAAAGRPRIAPMMFRLIPAAALGLLLAAAPVLALETRAGLTTCRLAGVEHDAWCGSLKRPLDPAQPNGLQIDIHYALLPALARNRKPDPVFFFAGGPGQSAIELAGPVGRMLARLSNRRDIVFIDQRGTGRSAPLRCEELPPAAPLAQSADPARQVAQMQVCRLQLEQLPYAKQGGLAHYATWVAMQDADAVRAALGVAQVDLVGGSYGTRAALEYLRQFPRSVRRAVIDGVAPPDMVLPASFSTDNQAALDGEIAACEAEPACHARHPALRADWRVLLAGLPRSVQVAHPVTGAAERINLTREMALGLVRAPLYVPALTAALPAAIAAAAQGRFEPLLGLASATAGNGAGKIFEGMHFSVVCGEDLPRLAQSGDRPGADFGDTFAASYRRICADWPRAEVPAAFYTMPPAASAVLLLSGGADPVTPPRHAQRVAQALGAKARHVVVPQAGHGVMALGCMRDVLYRFIDAASDDEALRVDADCARNMPRPGAFVPLAASEGEAAK
jgi:pimeloyl-ACP methyl ester carboxylesterase